MRLSQKRQVSEWVEWGLQRVDIVQAKAWQAGPERGGPAHLLFVEDLHGIVVPGLLVFHQHYPPEGARAEGLDSFKLIQVGCVLSAEGSAGSGHTLPAASRAKVWGILSTTGRGGPGEHMG